MIMTNSLHRILHRMAVNEFLVWTNWPLATLSPHEGNKRGRERELIEGNESLTFVQFLIHIYVSFFRSKRRGWRGFSLKNSTRAERYFFSNDTISIFDRLCRKSRGREAVLANEKKIYICNRRKMNYPLEYLQWSKPCHSIFSLKAACIHLRIWEKESFE